jgi:hypothetical protein
MKRTKIAALLGAGLLTFGITGVAFASTDLQQNQAGITLSEKDATGTADCDGIDVPDGGAALHFVLTGSSDSDGSLDVDLSNPDVNPHADNVTKANNGTLQWWVTAEGATGDTVLEGATTSATGDNLVLSHVCFGAAITAAPTPTEVPSQGQANDTNAPSQPSTDSVVGTGNSGPSDTAWLLVVALGVILASVVVLTPARSKTRR